MARHLRLAHRFVCLSDVPVSCDRVPIKHRWPGWWSKIELFRPGLFKGPTIYFDLDVMVVGPLDDVAIGHRFALLKSFWPQGIVNSSVMAWSVDMSAIYDKFSQRATEYMNEYRTIGKWGDQDFIARHCPEREYLQVSCPKKFASYKLTMDAKPKISQECAVIIFHGEPKPWSTPLWAPYIAELSAPHSSEAPLSQAIAED